MLCEAFDYVELSRSAVQFPRVFGVWADSTAHNSVACRRSRGCPGVTWAWGILITSRKEAGRLRCLAHRIRPATPMCMWSEGGHYVKHKSGISLGIRQKQRPTSHNSKLHITCRLTRWRRLPPWVQNTLNRQRVQPFVELAFRRDSLGDSSSTCKPVGGAHGDGIHLRGWIQQ